jgi:hypothetical protein
MIFDNDDNTAFGGPPVAVLAPLTSSSVPVDAHSCFSIGVIEIAGPRGNAQAIVGIIEGIDPWGQPRSLSVPLVDMTMLQQADPSLLPPLDLGLDEPQQWWAGVLGAFTESTDGQTGCLIPCWQCDAVCGAPVGGAACMSASPCPDDGWADERYQALQKKQAAAKEKAVGEDMQHALLVAMGTVGCVAAVLGLGCVGAAITKAGQTLTPYLLGPVADAAAAGGAASLGGLVGLTALGILGIMAFIAGTGLVSLALGAAAIAACIAAGLVTLMFAHKAYVAALEMARAEYAADLAALLGAMCGCGSSGYTPPRPSCIGKHASAPAHGVEGSGP